jgi:predicted alpha/beta hydrolase family esterase
MEISKSETLIEAGSCLRSNMRLWQRLWARNDEAARQNKTAERPKPSHPLLAQWLKLDGEDVMLFGEGKPPLRIKG